MAAESTIQAHCSFKLECGELGHIKRYCKDHKAQKERKTKAEKEGQKERKTKSQKATTTQENSDSESSGLMASHAMSVSSSNEQCAWIVDSGATCHMWRTMKLQ